MPHSSRKPKLAVTLTVSIIILLVTSGLSLAKPDITIQKHITAGERIDVLISDPDATHSAGTLQVVYRPGSTVEKTETLPVGEIARGENGTVSWSPTDPGIARLTYTAKIKTAQEFEDGDDATALVGIKFASLPFSGFAVMLLAGLFLFGGCWYSFRLLNLEEEKKPKPPVEKEWE